MHTFSPKQSKAAGSSWLSLVATTAVVGSILGASTSWAAETATATGAPNPGRQPASAHPASAGLEKPNWLSDLSLAVKEGYDDNVYLSGASPQFLPAAYTLPPGSVAAIKDRTSWVTTVSPKIGINLAPVLGSDCVQAIALGYSPDFAIYHNQPTEDYLAHRFPSVIKVKADSVSLKLDNGFAYIDGSSVAPTYPGALLSAFGTGAPRERRQQIQDRGSVVLQYDLDRWFVRPTASLLYYDLMTRLVNVTGYQNYPDRFDVNGGADLGFKVLPQLAGTVGYRTGHQYQQQFDFSPYSSPSDYQRIVLGVEGKPWPWLELKLQGGPDFRSYPSDTATHITPVGNKHPTTYFGEGLVTATVTTNDCITFKYKQFQWVSSIGKVPYFDSCFDLSYHRKLTQRLGFDAGARVLGADYTSGDLATCKRNDLQYTVCLGIGYQIAPHIVVNTSYSLDLGRNAQEAVVNPETREYERDLVSAGLTVKF